MIGSPPFISAMKFAHLEGVQNNPIRFGDKNDPPMAFTKTTALRPWGPILQSWCVSPKTIKANGSPGFSEKFSRHEIHEGMEEEPGYPGCHRHHYNHDHMFSRGLNRDPYVMVN